MLFDYKMSGCHFTEITHPTGNTTFCDKITNRQQELEEIFIFKVNVIAFNVSCFKTWEIVLEPSHRC
jgi:hypothetical protein